ncbi:hypothetical protein HK096_005817 [Nowakowskiella sp. JEL0078]|nr:hypothetical protein HK096_005817 [Nowakowskiella sp. JEL0078]
MADKARDSLQRSSRAMSDKLHIEGRFFTTDDGRSLWLRGVNLSGNAKNPSEPYLDSHISDKFYDHKNISFVGRPFPLSEADEHFARLKHWGFNFFRFNVTWEAIEHEGPGIYDEEYLKYVIEILLKAKEHKLKCFIDPHQDMWSRLSGGSGAPGWTFDVAGLEPENFYKTGAAIVHSQYPDPANYPRMVWNTNVNKLAAATMYILFFGGNTFAPKLEYEGQPIQNYLQTHFFSAFAELAKRIVHTPGLADSVVVGYDTFNEPMGGWIGRKDLAKLDEHQVRNDNTPTPFQAMLLGEGIPCEVEYYKMTRFGAIRVANRIINPQKTRAWQKSSGCIWALHGVWDKISKKLMKPDYFYRRPLTGEAVEFSKDFWRPYVREFGSIMRGIHQQAILFIEPSPYHIPPAWDPAEGDPIDRICFSPHWYDGYTLVTKSYTSLINPDVIGYIRKKYKLEIFAIKLGKRAINKSFVNQLDTIRNEGLTLYGEHPCLMGEIGIPFDMDGKSAYSTGNYNSQIKSMDMTMNALDRNLINFTVWNYCPDNTHEWGDGWNGEDLSLWSRSTHQPQYLSLPGTRSGSPASDVTHVFHLSPTQMTIPNTEGLRQRSQKNLFEEITVTDMTEAIPLQILSHKSKTSDTNGTLHSRTPFTTQSQEQLVIELTDEHHNSGARALEAFSRPYPILTPGEPRALSFDMSKRQFVFTFRHPTPEAISAFKNEVVTRSLIRFGWPSADRLTRAFTTPIETTLNDLRNHVAKLSVEIYLPRVHFPTEVKVETWSSDELDTATSSCSGVWRLDRENQRIFYTCSCAVAILQQIDALLDAVKAIPSPELAYSSSSASRPTARMNGKIQEIQKTAWVTPTMEISPEIEHTIVMRAADPRKKPIAKVGRELLEKRKKGSGMMLGQGRVDFDEEAECCDCSPCSLM